MTKRHASFTIAPSYSNSSLHELDHDSPNHHPHLQHHNHTIQQNGKSFQSAETIAENMKLRMNRHSFASSAASIPSSESESETDGEIPYEFMDPNEGGPPSGVKLYYSTMVVFIKQTITILFVEETGHQDTVFF